MGPRTHAAQTDELPRPRLDEQLKRSHPLIKLSQLMNWEQIERSLGAYFASKLGRPALSPRLVAGLAVSAACQ
jgi:transposase, IS5 family